MADLIAFVRESNRIEGILREPTQAEIRATIDFVALPRLAIADLVRLVGIYQPGARLRSSRGLDVRVGNHIAPLGGPQIADALAALLWRISEEAVDPWHTHLEYETLHPFTDGNGRSGRAIWLWQRGGEAPLGFLRHFYYETLGGARKREVRDG